MMMRRVGYLDSIRGIAALVVALGHFSHFYVNFFIGWNYAALPLLQRILMSPGLLMLECDTAVCLFFVLSGFVLSKVFASHLGEPVATLSGRAIRLFVPGLCACAFGFLVFFATVFFIPNEAGAGIFTHWTSVLKELFVNVPLLGYQGQSIFDRLPLLGPYVAAQAAGANSPLWSLSVEWQGSLAIFGLLALRRSHYRLWVIVMLALSLFFIRHWFICFLAGHVLAVGARRVPSEPWRPWARRTLASANLALGFFLCALAAEAFIGPFGPLIAARLPLPSCNDPQDAERIYAAILIFAGIFGLTELHRPLEHKALAWLGRMSFPIYLTHYPIEQWVVPLLFKELPSWFWVPSPALFAISPQIEFSGPLIAAFIVVILLTLAAATIFLKIDKFAISTGHKLRAHIAARHPTETT